jgi:hypothetical protein
MNGENINDGTSLIQKDDQIIGIKENAFKFKSLFQKLLAKYPNLLAEDQLNQSEPRRRLLTFREASVPMREETVGRLSPDHLSIDRDSMLTEMSCSSVPIGVEQCHTITFGFDTKTQGI